MMETLRDQRSAAVNRRAPVFAALAVIGIIQIGSTVTMLLHFTGYIKQTDSFSGLQNNTQVVKETVLSERLTHFKDRKAPKSPRKHTPAAHLPIKPLSRQTQRDVHATLIHWNPDQGLLSQFTYHNGRILIQKSGLYYIYAKTCFRQYDSLETDAGSSPGFRSNRPQIISPSDGGVQLIQYVYHERLSNSAPLRSSVIMKTGSTRRWKGGEYNMCCQQQGGVFLLRTGDGLFVSVSNSWMLDPEAEGSYFGAFRISK